MVFFLFCVEYIIVLIHVLFFQFGDGIFQKSGIDTIKELIDHLSQFDVLRDDNLFVLAEFLMIIDFVHGERRYLFR